MLEALASTRLNLLFDVGFNKECGGNSCVYWTKETNNLSNLIAKSDLFSDYEIENFDTMSTKLVKDKYDWSIIVSDYEKLFMQ